jgi:hypothetical protein
MRCATTEDEVTYGVRVRGQDVGGFARSRPDPCRALSGLSRAGLNHGPCLCDVQLVRNGVLSYSVDIIVILEFRQP